MCTCRLEHLSEMPVFRFMQDNNNDRKHEDIQETLATNDVSLKLIIVKEIKQTDSRCSTTKILIKICLWTTVL